jgi:hypothetical protein
MMTLDLRTPTVNYPPYNIVRNRQKCKYDIEVALSWL